MTRSEVHAVKVTMGKSSVDMARSYLFSNLRKHPLCRSYVGDDIDITGACDFSKEIFSTILVLTIISDLPYDIQLRMVDQFKNRCNKTSHWCFFLQENKWSNFPNDLDTTSLVVSQLLRRNLISCDVALSVCDDMMGNRNEDGIIQVYFDPDRSRIDPIVSTNVMYLMHQIGIANREELLQSKEYVRNFLVSGEYLGGTRYYPSPDSFLFFLTRLIVDFEDAFNDLKGDVRAQLLERVGSTEHSLDLAMRVIALQRLGITNGIECRKLYQQQLSDGGWVMNGLFLAPSKNLFFGGRELTSAFALEAITSAGV